jgi:hypothetical protein
MPFYPRIYNGSAKQTDGLDREFAYGIANELRGTGRYQGLLGGIVIPELTHTGLFDREAESPEKFTQGSATRMLFL